MIPKTFQIANRTWHVRFKHFKNKRNHGLTRFSKAVIYLDDRLLREGSEELLIHTFIHELLHATSGTMGWDRVNDDESRIDSLAALLAQAFATAE